MNIIAGQGTTRNHALTRAAWRFATGAHLDGIRRTDAGWVSRGTRAHAGHDRVSRWSLLSRAERAALRLGTTAAAGGAGWGLLEHPTATHDGLLGVGAAAGVAGTYGAVRGARNYPHSRNWIKPLHVALAGPLGLPEGMVPRSYIHIPRDYPGRTDIGRIDLPPQFTGETSGSIASIIKTKLGLSNATVTFKLEGRRPHLLIRQTPRPPAKVLFASAEVRALVEQAAESAPLIGLGPQSSVVSVDLDSESPHILVSASTGGGKSVITRTMACQMLRNGAQFVVLDFKRHSHKWAKDMPNVTYLRDIGDIHDALVALGAEGNRRNHVVDDWEGDDRESPVGPRTGIILEEANATISKLKRYWTATREKEDPKESPAIDALREILFMGRAVKMHMFLVAQSATAAALGGPEVRECFSTRILARYTRNAWMMLVPEVQPIPRSTRHIGRAQVVLGGAASETQVAFFTDSEARSWALGGTVSPAGEWAPAEIPAPRQEADVPASHPEELSVYLGKEGGTVPGRHLRAVPEPGTETAPVGLGEAIKAGILTVSLESARAARKRDPEFPESVAKKGQELLYDPAALGKWERNRPRNPAGEVSNG